MMSTPPNRENKVSVAPTCSTAGVGLDGTFGAGYSVAALAGLGNNEEGLVVAGVLGATLHGLSMYTALKDKAECRELKDAHAAYLDGLVLEKEKLKLELLEQRAEDEALEAKPATGTSENRRSEEDMDSKDLPNVAAPIPPPLKTQPPADSRGDKKQTKDTKSDGRNEYSDFWTEQKP